MNKRRKEQHTPSGQQFIHPMPLWREKPPVTAPEMQKLQPPSQPVVEEHSNLAQWTNSQTEVDTPEEANQPLSSPSFTAKDHANAPVKRIKPIRMIPENVTDSTTSLTAPLNSYALQQEGFMSASRTLPQSKEKSLASEYWKDETQLETGQDTAILRPVRKRGHRSIQKRQKSRKRHMSIWLAVVSVITLVVIVLNQGNGTMGAWAADEVRTVAGPVAAARVESWYLNAQNTTYRWEYQMGLHHVVAPLQMKSARKSAPPAQAVLKSMPLTTISPLISPKLDGEGTWNILETAPGVNGYLPLDASTFIRPDPTTSYAVVSLLQFDVRFIRLHIVAGTREPGGPRGVYGPGSIPQADQEGNALLATLNGGFKYADGAFGLMTNGKVYVPPQQNAATIAITKSGRLLLGAWGIDPQLKSDNTNLIAWRQNAGLLIDNGKISTLAKDGVAWGGTILNKEYTWRSGLGITAQGNLVYAAGNALVPETLGIALKAAGAVMAMEIDINPFWTRAFLYHQDKGGTLTINKLNIEMHGTGNEYLVRNQRDFFYLTRYTPPTHHT